MFRWSIFVLLSLLTGLLVASPVRAGTIEVTVREADGSPLEDRHLKIRPLLVAGETDAFGHIRLQRWQRTDAAGKMIFRGVDKGTYAIDVAIGGAEPYVRPANNPFAPTPRVTLLNFDDHLTVDVVLWRGVRVTAAVELSEGDAGGFRAVFTHPGSGMTGKVGFSRDKTSIERVLPPGVWDVTVEPKAGYLLVAFDRDRVPLPGHSARLDLLHEPSSTFLTWTYTTPAAIEGSAFTDKGKVAPVEIVATLVEPGPWHQAAVERGGSNFNRVTASPDPITGDYRMLVPDGSWRVQPESPALLESDPEAVDLTLTPGQTGQASFIVRMKKSGIKRWLYIDVENERNHSLRQATVEIYDLSAPDEPVRKGLTDDHGTAAIEGLNAGSYRIVAGHVDYVEGKLELPKYDPKGPEARSSYTVVLGDGAQIRLRARDPIDQPLAGVELTVERVGEDPDVLLQAEDVREAKRKRTAVTDHSGHASIRGYYPGTYQVRAKLRGERGTRGMMYLSLGDDEGFHRGGRELEIEIIGGEQVDLVGRMLPAASLSSSLLCSDDWDLPDTVAVRVFRAYDDRGSELDPLDFDPDQANDSTPGIMFAADDMMLGGRIRDGLTLGPFEQGVYYLAIKPQDFDRWTWAFETHDTGEASRLQVTVEDSLSSPDGVASGVVALGDVDLGLFAVECAPAVDLLPAVAGDVPVKFPDVREVGVEARFFDLDSKQPDKPVKKRLSIIRRNGEIRLRGCPAGRLRLDFTLSHPHFLPEPSLSWQVEIELDRGWYRQIIPEIEALGGAIEIAGGEGTAILHGPDGLRRQAGFEEGRAVLPSLAPGRYRVEVASPEAETARTWRDLEVLAGETLRLQVDR